MKVSAAEIDKLYFEAVENGSKTFEIRINDRNYEEGDVIFLLEFDNGKRTSRELVATVGYVCDYAQKEGYVVFSLIDVEVN